MSRDVENTVENGVEPSGYGHSIRSAILFIAALVPSCLLSGIYMHAVAGFPRTKETAFDVALWKAGYLVLAVVFLTPLWLWFGVTAYRHQKSMAGNVFWILTILAIMAGVAIIPFFVVP